MIGDELGETGKRLRRSRRDVTKYRKPGTRWPELAGLRAHPNLFEMTGSWEDKGWIHFVQLSTKQAATNSFFSALANTSNY
jgi:hypothetical protein